MDVSERLLLMNPLVQSFYRKRIDFLISLNRLGTSLVFLSDVVDYIKNNPDAPMYISYDDNNHNLKSHKFKKITLYASSEIDIFSINDYDNYIYFYLRNTNDAGIVIVPSESLIRILPKDFKGYRTLIYECCSTIQYPTVEI